jgi:hypothetical protein
VNEFERRIRDANPTPVRRTTAVSARAEEELNELLASAPQHAPRPVSRRTRRRIGTAWATAIAAALVFATVIVAGNVTNRPAPSAAFAPPLLTSVSIEGTTGEILNALGSSAGDRMADAASERTVLSEAWSANISIEDNAVLDIFVQPQEVRRTWSDDLSGRIVSRAGAVKWGGETTDSAAAKPGTVLVDEDFGPGMYPTFFVAPPPTTVDDMRSYLAAPFGLGEQSTTGEWFKAINDLRADWPLDGAQNTAILQVIATLPDVTVAGTVTDRLGRTGVAVQTDSRADGKFRDILVFDSATGMLISSEFVYLGGLTDISLPAMTVLDYTAWKDED